MKDLPFLDGYAGQSVDELIALESTHRIDSILMAFDQALGQKEHREGRPALSTEEVTIMAVEALQGEVNNGGYEQFFQNTSVEYAPDIVAALQRIDCPECARITQKAIDALQLPTLTVEKIEMTMEEDDEERDEIMEACDDEFFEYPDPIEEKLFAFIKANRGKIRF